MRNPLRNAFLQNDMDAASNKIKNAKLEDAELANALDAATFKIQNAKLEDSSLANDFDAATFKIQNAKLENASLSNALDAATFKIQNAKLENASLSNAFDAATFKIQNAKLENAVLFNALDAATFKIKTAKLEDGSLSNDFDAAGFKIKNAALEDAVLSNDLDAAGHRILNLPGGGGIFDVTEYGAIADAKTITDITMAVGSSVVTSAGTTFTSADIGKYVIIRGGTDANGVSPLHTTIVSINGNSATLANISTSGVTNFDVSSSFARMDYGTNNVIAFNSVIGLIRNYGPGPIDSSGGTMYIPPGNYMVVSTSNVYYWYAIGNIKITGAGMGITNLFYTSNPAINPGGSGLFVIGLSAHVTISDFTLTDLNYYFGGGNGINCQQVDDLTLERLELINCKGNGCLNVQGGFSGGVPTTYRVRIRNNYIHGDVAGGWIFGFPNGIEGDGINAGQLNDVHVTGNTIIGTGRHAYEGGGNCYDQYIAFNTIDMKGNGGSGINPTGGNRTTVAYNNIKNVKNGATFAVDFTTDVGVAWTAKDNRVIGNYITCSGQAAIRLQNTSDDTTVNHVDRLYVAENYVQALGANVSAILLGGGTNQFADVRVHNNIFKVDSPIITYVNVTTANPAKFVVVKDNFIGTAEILNLVGISQADAKQLLFENNQGGVVYLLNNSGRYGHPITRSDATGNIAAGATAGYSFTFYGAVPGMDEVVITPGLGFEAGLIMTGYVTAAGTVSVSIYNPTAGVLNTGTPMTLSLRRFNTAV